MLSLTTFAFPSTYNDYIPVHDATIWKICEGKIRGGYMIEEDWNCV
jgi:hypothetical protein